MDSKTLLASVFCFCLILGSLIVAFTIPVMGAGGGGFVQSGATNNNGGTASCAVTLSNVQKGDFLIIGVWVLSGSTVSSVADGGDSFSKAVSSTVNVDTEEWIAAMNQASGSITVTATLSGSVANKCILVEVSNLLSTTADITSTGSGTANAATITMTVTSYTPPADDYCQAFGGLTGAGAWGTITQAPSSPFFADRLIGTGANTKVLASYFNANSPGTANTASNLFTTQGATTLSYDAIVACFPGGITTVTTTPTTVTTTSTIVKCSNCGEAPNYSWLLVFPFILIILVLLIRRR